jgi:excisionase family DNA binding protein
MSAASDSIVIREPETCSVEEAARIIGIGRSAAYEACRRDELPNIRVGRRVLVLRRPLDRLLGLDDTDEGRE